MIGLLQRVSEASVTVEGRTVGTDMKVHLVNDGPATFWLRATPK